MTPLFTAVELTGLLGVLFGELAAQTFILVRVCVCVCE
jgi:hypothetical protein